MKIKLLSLLCAVGMIASIFLPWLQVKSSMSATGFGSLNSSEDIFGYYLPVAWFSAGVSLLAGIMALTRFRITFAFGVINLFIGIASVCGWVGDGKNLNVNLESSGFGASYGIHTAIGLYIFIALCVAFIAARYKDYISLFGIKNAQPFVETGYVEQGYVQQGAVPNNTYATRAIQDSPKSNRTIIGLLIAIVVLGLGGGGYYLFSSNKTESTASSDPLQEAKDLHDKMMLKVDTITILIDAKKYDEAIAIANQLSHNSTLIYKQDIQQSYADYWVETKSKALKTIEGHRMINGELFSTEASSSEVVTYADMLVGEWSGKFGNKELILTIDEATKDRIVGSNKVGNTSRPISGRIIEESTNGNYQLLSIELEEPGDQEWDGKFNITIQFKFTEGTDPSKEYSANYIEESTAKGEWIANNGKKTTSFQLIH